MLDKHAAVQVASVAELCDQLRHFLSSPEALRSLENNVAEATAGFRHIVTDYADIIGQAINSHFKAGAERK